MPSGLGQRVGAVIVNYNAGEHLLACVASLRAEGIGDVVVVDNGSADGSCRALAGADPAVRIVDPGRNVGYGAGVNRGLAVLPALARPPAGPAPAQPAGPAPPSQLVLVGNPDILVQPGAVAALASALDSDPRVALAGPRIVGADGERYPSARTFPSMAESLGHGFVGLVVPGNRWSRRYKMADWDHAQAREVDWVSGACFLVRRTVLEALGGFDEAYFMYSEDVDLCWRVAGAGWRVLYEPAATVTHIQGVSAEHHPYRMIVAHHRSLLRFANRTTGGWRRALLPFVAAGLALRAALSAVARWREDEAGRPGR